MRVFALGPLNLGVVFFRDPTPRVAIVVKTTLRIVENPAGLKFDAPGAPLSIERRDPAMPRFAFHGNDFVPRKGAVDFTIVGRAYAPEPRATFPVEVSLQGGISKHLTVTNATGARQGSVAATSVPLSPATMLSDKAQPAWMGPVAKPPLVAAPPRNEWEAWWSDHWVDVPSDARPDHFQVAPPDQRTSEVIGPGAMIRLHNLTRAGGRIKLALPAFSPWVLFIEPRRAPSTAAPLGLSLDSLHLDTELGTLELLHRGTVELRQLTGRPDSVTGLGPAGSPPSQHDLEQLLALVSPVVAHSPWAAASAPEPSAETEGIVDEETLSDTESTLEFQTNFGPRKHGLEGFTEDPVATAKMAALFASRPTTDTPHRSTTRGTSRRREVDRESPTKSEAMPPVEMPRLIGTWTIGDLVLTHHDRAVFEAKETHEGPLCRLSILHAALARDDSDVALFQHEIEVRARITHSRIPPVLDSGVAPDRRPYFVDVVAPGRSVADCPPTTYPMALAWMDGILDALQAIHGAGLVHGALRADGVFIDGANVVVVVTPALRPPRTPPDRAHFSDDLHGPPEIARREWGAVDEKSDLFFAAAIFHQAVTGQPIHGRSSDPSELRANALRPVPSVTSLAPHVPSTVAALVERALSLDPALRPSSALELRTELRKATRLDRTVALPLLAATIRHGAGLDDTPVGEKTRASVSLLDKAFVSTARVELGLPTRDSDTQTSATLASPSPIEDPATSDAPAPTVVQTTWTMALGRKSPGSSGSFRAVAQIPPPSAPGHRKAAEETRTLLDRTRTTAPRAQSPEKNRARPGVLSRPPAAARSVTPPSKPSGADVDD